VPTFLVSTALVEKARPLKLDWVRPRFARRDLSEGLFNTIAGYAAEKRAGGLAEGKGTTLLASGSIEREFRDRMRHALGLYDAIIGGMLVELRDWTLKARGRRRDYPWGYLFAEGEWLWVIPASLPLDSWATERPEKVPMKTSLEIRVIGRAGAGKSTIAHEIAQHLASLGFHAVVEDPDPKQNSGVYALRLGSLAKVGKEKGLKVLVKTQQVQR